MSMVYELKQIFQGGIGTNHGLATTIFTKENGINTMTLIFKK